MYEALGSTYGQRGGARSVPTHSQLKSEPRGVACTPFIENLGGAHMHGIRAGADGGPEGATICIHMQMVEKHNISIQAHRGLTTAAKQPGWGKRRAPRSQRHVFYMILSSF